MRIQEKNIIVRPLEAQIEAANSRIEQLEKVVKVAKKYCSAIVFGSKTINYAKFQAMQALEAIKELEPK